MATVQELIKQAADAQDYTQETKSSNIERELPEAGMAVCRLREYIELGVQPTATKAYPNKKPARKARFVFELTTPKHVREVEKEDKSIIKIPHTLSVFCVISTSEKSNFIKLFRQLNWNGDIKHPAEALGRPFLVEIVHAWKQGDDPKKDKPTYANMMKDGMYTLAAPRKVDPVAGTVEELKVPEMLGDIKLFLWDNPTQETWDSLFIDGTYEKDGKDVSKNWIQELICEAVDFPTSPLYTLISGVNDLGKTNAPTVEQNGSESPATENTASKTSSTETTSPSETGSKPVDPLADLGI